MSDSRNFPKDWADELLEDEQSNAAGAPVASPAPQPEPAPPAGAREFYERDRRPHDIETYMGVMEFAQAYAALERARADAAERNLALSRQQYSDYRREAIKEYGQYEAEVESLRSELREAREARDMLSRERKGEVWCWQDDPDDHPESLNCPVLVQADVIRRFVAAEAQLRDMSEALTRHKKMADLLRIVAEEKPEMKVIAIAPVLLGSLEPATAADIKRGQALSRKEDKAL